MKEGVPPPKFSEKDIVEFIFFPVVNEGCRVIDEGEAGSAQVGQQGSQLGQQGSQLGQQGSQLQACVCLAAVPLIAVNCRYAHRPGSHTAHMPATGAEPSDGPIKLAPLFAPPSARRHRGQACRPGCGDGDGHGLPRLPRRPHLLGRPRGRRCAGGGSVGNVVGNGNGMQAPCWPLQNPCSLKVRSAPGQPPSPPPPSTRCLLTCLQSTSAGGWRRGRSSLRRRAWTASSSRLRSWRRARALGPSCRRARTPPPRCEAERRCCLVRRPQLPATVAACK